MCFDLNISEAGDKKGIRTSEKMARVQREILPLTREECSSPRVEGRAQLVEFCWIRALRVLSLCECLYMLCFCAEGLVPVTIHRETSICYWFCSGENLSSGLSLYLTYHLCSVYLQFLPDNITLLKTAMRRKYPWKHCSTPKGKTGMYNDCASYFSMGGSVSTEIIFPLLKPGSEIYRQFP